MCMSGNEVTNIGCIFVNEVMKELEYSEEAKKLFERAKNVGCNDQCTLEDGCKLYKALRMISADEKLQRAGRLLRKEFTLFMLGEEA